MPQRSPIARAPLAAIAHNIGLAHALAPTSTDDFPAGATLADAFARCIDDSHARAQGLTGLQDAREAERVRASAQRLAVDMSAAIAALVELPMTAPHRHAPKDDAKEADHLADLAVGSRPFCAEIRNEDGQGFG